MSCERRKDQSGDWICDRCKSMWTEMLDETGWRPKECRSLALTGKKLDGAA